MITIFDKDGNIFEKYDTSADFGTSDYLMICLNLFLHNRVKPDTELRIVHKREKGPCRTIRFTMYKGCYRVDFFKLDPGTGTMKIHQSFMTTKML